MNQMTTLTPAALYARVSSDRQDVDLSVAAQLGRSGTTPTENGYIVAREYVDEAESGRSTDRPEFRKMINAASATRMLLSRRFWSGSSAASPASGSTPWPSSPCCGARVVRVVSITEHADDTPHRQADGGHHRVRGRIL